MSMLKIGIVSETLVQQHYLRHAIEESGYTPAGFFVVHQVLESIDSLKGHSQEVDAWLIDVDMERLSAHKKGDAFEQWVFNLTTPIIFGDGTTYNAAEEGFLSWTRQLKNKLLNLSGQLQLAKQKDQSAEYVWVLAASTGGPDAVKAFLDVFNEDLGVSFIYAQHIDQKLNHSLGKTVTKGSCYESRLIAHGDVINRNTVLVVPTDSVVTIQDNGTVVAHKDRIWSGDYQPSIDQVVANVGSIYGERSGVIIFTGMGDDGALGCRLMSLYGGQVWAQSIESCDATSMPEVATATGCVNKTDTPENLAKFLQQYIKLVKKAALAV